MNLDQIRAPISADAPCGGDTRYDDDFQALKSEVGKQGAVSARTDFDRLVQRGSELLKGGGDGPTTVLEEAGGPDYDRVVELAERILTTKSKDLQTAGFLCLGLFRTRGFEGLAEAVEGYHALLETHWDGLYPELRRLDGRRLAVQWLADRVGGMVPSIPADPGDRSSIERGISACRAIDALMKQRISDDPPTTSALARALTEVRDALPAEPSAAPTPAAGPTAVAGAGPVMAAAAPSFAAAVPASEEDAVRAVSKAADFLRTLAPHAPLGYRLLRAARWDLLPGLPPSDGGRTMLPPPEDMFRQRLQLVQGGGNGEDILVACEEIFYESPNEFWLDLQRVADQALGVLGAPYATLRRLLRHEVARLLERLSGLEGLAFNDGTPFADGATREWIEREIRPLSAEGPRAAAPASGAGDDRLAEHLEAARQQADGGDLSGALEALHDAQRTDPRRRARFVRQAQMGRLSLAQGRLQVARALLEELDEQIDRFGLAEWEPELCIEVWGMLLRCYEGLQASSDEARENHVTRMDRIFDRLCRLDVRAALSQGARQ